MSALLDALRVALRMNEQMRLMTAEELQAVRAVICTAEAQPLTDEQLLELLGDVDAETKRLPPGVKAFARAIEAAHGVTGSAA